METAKKEDRWNNEGTNDETSIGSAADTGNSDRDGRKEKQETDN